MRVASLGGASVLHATCSISVRVLTARGSCEWARARASEQIKDCMSCFDVFQEYSFIMLR